MTDCASPRRRTRHEDKASAYFAILNLAQAAGDYAAAARAQRLLARLGWIVTRRKYPRAAHPLRQTAAGPGGGS
jgi:hypothetical protein